MILKNKYEKLVISFSRMRVCFCYEKKMNCYMISMKNILD